MTQTVYPVSQFVDMHIKNPVVEDQRKLLVWYGQRNLAVALVDEVNIGSLVPRDFVLGVETDKRGRITRSPMDWHQNWYNAADGVSAVWAVLLPKIEPRYAVVHWDGSAKASGLIEDTVEYEELLTPTVYSDAFGVSMFYRVPKDAEVKTGPYSKGMFTVYGPGDKIIVPPSKGCRWRGLYTGDESLKKEPLFQWLPDVFTLS